MNMADWYANMVTAGNPDGVMLPANPPRFTPNVVPQQPTPVYGGAVSRPQPSTPATPTAQAPSGMSLEQMMKMMQMIAPPQQARPNVSAPPVQGARTVQMANPAIAGAMGVPTLASLLYGRK